MRKLQETTNFIEFIFLIAGCAYCIFLASEAILSEGSERIETLIELMFASLSVLLMVIIFHQLQKLG